MSPFDFIFSFIGLLLGLSLVEVLGGLMRTVKARGHVKIGVLTPLLGVNLIGIATCVWGIAWELRDKLAALPSVWPMLGMTVVLFSTFHIAASLVFPDRPAEFDDLDDHYWKTKRLVGLLAFGCMLVTLLIELLLGRVFNPLNAAMNVAILVVTLLAALVPGRRANIAALSLLLLILAAAFSF